MITDQDIGRTFYPELEGKDIDEIQVGFLRVFCLFFTEFHGILYTDFLTMIVNYTTVFCFIEGELMFNITKFGRLIYKVFDIKDYFL